MDIRDLSTLERTASWLEELAAACHKGTRIAVRCPRQAADVSRKARALQKSLRQLLEALMPSERSDSHEA